MRFRVWVCSITTNKHDSVFLASLLKCGEFLTAKLHYKEGSWVGLGLMRSCNNEQYLSFIAMLTLSQRLLSDASYNYQTQYEQCVLALYLNLSLINPDKISFLLCFRGRSCEHIIWKPPSPSSRKKNWQICEWLLPVARHDLLLQHGEYYKRTTYERDWGFQMTV